MPGRFAARRYRYRWLQFAQGGALVSLLSLAAACLVVTVVLVGVAGSAHVARRRAQVAAEAAAQAAAAALAHTGPVLGEEATCLVPAAARARTAAEAYARWNGATGPVRVTFAYHTTPVVQVQVAVPLFPGLVQRHASDHPIWSRSAIAAATAAVPTIVQAEGSGCQFPPPERDPPYPIP